MADFQKGDLVRLKSGGPTMTVDSFAVTGQYHCQWFSGSKLQKGLFDADSLAIAKDEDKKSK